MDPAHRPGLVALWQVDRCGKEARQDQSCLARGRHVRILFFSSINCIVAHRRKVEVAKESITRLRVQRP